MRPMHPRHSSTGLSRTYLTCLVVCAGLGLYINYRIIILQNHVLVRHPVCERDVMCPCRADECSDRWFRALLPASRQTLQVSVCGCLGLHADQDICRTTYIRRQDKSRDGALPRQHYPLDCLQAELPSIMSQDHRSLKQLSRHESGNAQCRELSPSRHMQCLLEK